MADIDKIKIGSTTYNISPSWSNITNKPNSFTPASHTHTKSEVGLGNVDNTADANKRVDYANSAGSVAWDNISSKPITITQKNNDSPVSGAYAYGTHVTMRNTNNWFEIYAPHMGTSSSRVYMQTGWDNDRQGWKAIAWTSDIPTSLPASDVYDWAKASTKPSYSWSEINNKPSTFPPDSHTHDYLPLDGSSAMTGTLILPINKIGLKFRDAGSWEVGTFYGSADNEALTFYSKSAKTSFQFICGSVPSSSNSWQTITPGLQIRDNKVIINKQLANGVSSDYNLEVNGNMYVREDVTSGGTINLSSSFTGIQFSKNSDETPFYVTNIEAGYKTFNVNNSSGTTGSITVTFNNGGKGKGSWYVVANAYDPGGTDPSGITVSISSRNASGCTFKVRRNTSASGNPTVGIYYIAIKYF